MILRFKQGILSLFSIIFAICFSIILLISLLYRLLIKSYQHIFSMSLSLVLFSTIVLLFFVAVYRIFSKLTRSGLRIVTICLSAAIGLMELAMIIFFHSILPPNIDGGHTYGEALYLLAHGHASGDVYFKIYPNNIPITVLRYWLYRLLSIVHISDYTIIDQTACAVVLNISIYFSWKLVLRLFDEKMANLYLLMAMTCFPLFLYITYFYTDTMALMFPAVLLYLWYLYHRSGKIRFLVLLGLFLGIGYEIRPNVILFLPALVIYMLFVLKPKKVLINLIVVAVMMAGACYSVQAYNRHLGYIPDPSLAMPSAHWIMIGLSRYGEYTSADFNLTFQQPTRQAKIKADLNQIKARMARKNVSGLLYLWVMKTGGTWGMGAKEYDFYTRISAHPTTAYQYLFGHQNRLILYIIQIFYVVTIFLLIFSVMNYLRTKRIRLNLLIQICLFGNFLFYTFLWEAEPRYSLLFTPFMLLGAVFGFDELLFRIQKMANSRAGKISKGRLIELSLSGVLLAGVIVCAWINLPGYTQNRTVQKQYIVDQEATAGLQSAFVDTHHTIRQTFRATGPFTHVSMNIRDRQGKGIYNFSVTDLSNHRRLFSENFTSAQAKPQHNLIFSTVKTKQSKTEDQITVRQVSGTGKARLDLSLYGNGYDRGSIYSGGYFMENGSVIKNAVLKFQVYSIQKKPYLSTESYYLLFLLPVLMLIFYVYTTPRDKKRKVKSICS
ncbi:glycosyltransferase family 39 protein [Sporolactobacillus sp. KGMB 08714]|uniref:glycosyltransferase family 39 protein n=1 Tax=Sporolactobacillus sp. KGMB 08714 TaxID=3064704 RepID=UPI002FBD3E75